MALTIRMRIDDNDEHSYYYATGSGEEINLQNKSASYSANGNYTIQADSGYDGLGTVSVAVDVPQEEPNLQEKSVAYIANDDYIVYPDSGYDGLSKVNVEVDVQGGGGATLVPLIDVVNANGTYTATPPAGADGFSDVSIDVQVSGGSSNVAEGTFTPSNGQSQSFSTGKTGTIQSIEIWTTDEDTMNSASVAKLLHSYNAIKQEGVAYYYKSLTYRSGTSGSTLSGEGNRSVMGTTATGTALSNVVGVSSNGGTIYYAGKTSGSSPSMGFYTGVSYKYRVVYQ